MKKLAALLLFASSGWVYAQTGDTVRVERVADDAKVLQRIAEVSERDFPRSVAEKILEEDLEILRGRRLDGSYRYANYEREENGRIEEGRTIKSKSESEPDVAEIRGEKVYRLILSVPSRRMLVRSNRRIYIDSVELDYTPFNAERASRTVEVKSWLTPGDTKEIDIPQIARKVTARVRAHAGDDGGGNLDLFLLKAKLVDDSRSPYFRAVQTIHSLRTASDRRNVKDVESLSRQLADQLGVSQSARREATIEERVDVFPGRTEVAVTTDRPSLEPTPQVEIYLELQGIEDLLTGTEMERREGVDRLHQLVRKLRPR